MQVRLSSPRSHGRCRRPASATPRPQCRRSSARGLPFTSSWNFPGAPGAFHGATQSRVRTHTRWWSGRVKFHGGHRVLHRHAEAVREQVGGSHLIHELLVHIPPAGFGELLGLQQDVLGGAGVRQAEQQDQGAQWGKFRHKETRRPGRHGICHHQNVEFISAAF